MTAFTVAELDEIWALVMERQQNSPSLNTEKAGLYRSIRKKANAQIVEILDQVN
jgi:hypothetical protein